MRVSTQPQSIRGESVLGRAGRGTPQVNRVDNGSESLRSNGAKAGQAPTFKQDHSNGDTQFVLAKNKLPSMQLAVQNVSAT